MKTIICVDKILTCDSQASILDDASIYIDSNRISNIVPNQELQSKHSEEVIDARGLVAIPGFVQTHIHLCQTLFRGLADDLQLLDWLQKKIFPFETAHNDRSMYYSSMLGISELLRSGTTTIMDMGSINHEEEIIWAIGESGLRAFVGKAMMDINDLYPKLKESTNDSLRSTRELAEQWHNTYDDRIKYAVAPRFVLSCTDRLMKEAFEMITSFPGMLFHTHASENKNEIDAIRKRCRMENVEFLNQLGVLSKESCLAHCIHLNENEIGILKNTRANIAHCPSSNLKLGSGIANIPYLLQNGITVSLGADGAPCNNTLNMFQEMRLASLIQKPIHGATTMDAKTVFEMATIGGAKALGLEKEIGSIEIGKKADIVLLNLDSICNPLSINGNNSIYSSIVYSSGPENVDSVMVDGRWIYRKKEFVEIDQKKVVSDSKRELKNLLARVS